jgi:hypothetical protein
VCVCVCVCVCVYVYVVLDDLGTVSVTVYRGCYCGTIVVCYSDVTGVLQWGITVESQ